MDRFVEAANRAVEAYTGAPEHEPDDPQAVLTDLLADLRHWADSIDEVDFHVAYGSASRHYTYELNHPEDTLRE